MLNNGSSPSATNTLPIGTEIYVINHSGRKIYIGGYWLSYIVRNATSSVTYNEELKKLMYSDRNTTKYRSVYLENGWVGSFVHLGNGEWKYLQQYVNDNDDTADF
jgi:hypothetical protein